MNIFLLCFVTSFLPSTFGNDFMFSFGTAYGDIQLTNTKNAVAQVYLKTKLSFFGVLMDQIYVDSNGVIWLNSYDPKSSKPHSFPVQQGQLLVACYWADTDVSANPASSRVFFRIAEDDESWTNATNILSKAFGSAASSQFQWASLKKVLIIATWVNVTYSSGSSTTPTNSFQCSILSDGSKNTYVFFNHVSLQWLNSPLDITNPGPAAVGIDTGVTGHSENNFSLPNSTTGLVTTLQSYTNFIEKTKDGGPFGWSAIPQKLPPPPYNYKIPGGTATKGCNGFGDPHYITFDDSKGLDNFFDTDVTSHQSSYTKDPYYTLTAVADCKSTDYPPFKISVFIQNYETSGGSNPLTTPAGMKIDFFFSSPEDGIQIILESDSYVIATSNRGNVVDGSQQTGFGNYHCPYYLCPTNSFWISVFNEGYQLNTNFGLTASYYNVTGNGGKVEVYLPYLDSLKGNVFGYCGNMDNITSNENLCDNAGDTSAETYQNCWYENPDSQRRQNSAGYYYCPYSFFDVQHYVKHSIVNAVVPQNNLTTQLCNVLTDPEGPFSLCQDDPNLDALFSTCQSDLLACNGLESVFCGYASILAQDCLALPNVTSLNWRNDTFCPPKCPINSHYSSLTTSCKPTCDDPLAAQFCLAPLAEGCECNQGFVVQNGKCVQLGQCNGCMDESGNYWSPGTSWLRSDCQERCACSKRGETTCTASGCDPHAKCLSVGAQATCKCNSGYYGNGFNCSSTDRCAPKNDCSNNSTCITSSNSYKCVCSNGYTGQYCEAEIDYCSPDPCVNGMCVNSLFGYTCNCEFGFEGATCDQKTNWCSSFPCTNLATCINLDSDYRCVCLPKYSGPNCECPFPSLDCSNLPDGNYADPCLICANNYYSCSGHYLWIMYCPSGLYFDDNTKICLHKADVPACNVL